jgi:hypothetical protein
VTPAILTEDFIGIHQSLKKSAGMVSPSAATAFFPVQQSLERSALYSTDGADIGCVVK